MQLVAACSARQRAAQQEICAAGENVLFFKANFVNLLTLVGIQREALVVALASYVAQDPGDRDHGVLCATCLTYFDSHKSSTFPEYAQVMFLICVSVKVGSDVALGLP